MKNERCWGLALLLVVASCGGAPAKPPGVPATVANEPLAIRAVEWNATKARVGKVEAVADSGDVAVVFANDGAHVFASGAHIATDTAVTDWVRADTIIGPDGSATWIVAVNAKGRLYHVRGRTQFEDVSERYGLGQHKVRDAAAIGTGWVGFLLDNELALADDKRVTRYGVPRFTELNGGGGFGVGVSKDSVFTFTARHRAVRTFALPNATHAVLNPEGRLFATTARGVYATNTAHDLVLMYETKTESIHGLVASAEHIWFAIGDELGVVDGNTVSLTKGAKIPPDAKLLASTTGDVWVLSKTGALTRYARVDPEPEVAKAWHTSLSTVFARSCASCHQANGPAGVDLSNAEAWHSHRTAIRERVIVSRTMPPQGHELTDADRAAVKAWTEAP